MKNRAQVMIELKKINDRMLINLKQLQGVHAISAEVIGDISKMRADLLELLPHVGAVVGESKMLVTSAGGVEVRS